MWKTHAQTNSNNCGSTAEKIMSMTRLWKRQKWKCQIDPAPSTHTHQSSFWNCIPGSFMHKMKTLGKGIMQISLASACSAGGVNKALCNAYNHTHTDSSLQSAPCKRQLSWWRTWCLLTFNCVCAIQILHWMCRGWGGGITCSCTLPHPCYSAYCC